MIFVGKNDYKDEEILEIDVYSKKELELSETVVLSSMDYCQDYWKTKQTKITVPSRHINGTKKAPIVPLVGVSIMSGKEDGNSFDFTGKGARIMNVKRIDKLYCNLLELRKIKPSTINAHIKKLLKLKTKEFEFINSDDNKHDGEQYYKLDYSDGFVTIDLRIIHYMLSCYKDNIIQAYIALLWICRNGWTQLTREQMARYLGLTIHSDKQAKIIMDKLVSDGFIENRTKYQYKQVIDKLTGIPKSIIIPYYEYRIIDLYEVECNE